uniref:Uncharacterized protein n=1 Tax=Glossina palpalis gambiensis TaxID=67801 RepID=A0A1B0BR55_9MUSC
MKLTLSPAKPLLAVVVGAGALSLSLRPYSLPDELLPTSLECIAAKFGFRLNISLVSVLSVGRILLIGKLNSSSGSGLMPAVAATSKRLPSISLAVGALSLGVEVIAGCRDAMLGVEWWFNIPECWESSSKDADGTK